MYFYLLGTNKKRGEIAKYYCCMKSNAAFNAQFWASHENSWLFGHSQNLLSKMKFKLIIMGKEVATCLVLSLSFDSLLKKIRRFAYLWKKPTSIHHIFTKLQRDDPQSVDHPVFRHFGAGSSIYCTPFHTYQNRILAVFFKRLDLGKKG